MSAWFFTYDGIEGRAERQGETVYIYWAGMGFHLEAASWNLAKAIKEAETESPDSGAAMAS